MTDQQPKDFQPGDAEAELQLVCDRNGGWHIAVDGGYFNYETAVAMLNHWLSVKSIKPWRAHPYQQKP